MSKRKYLTAKDSDYFKNYSLVKCFFIFWELSAQFCNSLKIELFVFLTLCFLSSLCVMDANPLSNVELVIHDQFID